MSKKAFSPKEPLNKGKYSREELMRLSVSRKPSDRINAVIYGDDRLRLEMLETEKNRSVQLAAAEYGGEYVQGILAYSGYNDVKRAVAVNGADNALDVLSASRNPRIVEEVMYHKRPKDLEKFIERGDKKTLREIIDMGSSACNEKIIETYCDSPDMKDIFIYMASSSETKLATLFTLSEMDDKEIRNAVARRSGGIDMSEEAMGKASAVMSMAVRGHIAEADALEGNTEDKTESDSMQGSWDMDY